MKALTAFAFLLAFAHASSADLTVILKLRPSAAHKLGATSGLPFRVVTIPDTPGALAALQARSGVWARAGLPVLPRRLPSPAAHAPPRPLTLIQTSSTHSLTSP